MALFRLLMVTTAMIRPMVLMAAPAYMSLTAVRTDCGATGRCGAGSGPADGYGWYMTAPCQARMVLRQPTRRADRPGAPFEACRPLTVIFPQPRQLAARSRKSLADSGRASHFRCPAVAGLPAVFPGCRRAALQCKGAASGGFVRPVTDLQR